jgi:hypothetical protein
MLLTSRSARSGLARTSHRHSFLSALVSASTRAIAETRGLGKIPFIAHSRGTDVLASALMADFIRPTLPQHLSLWHAITRSGSESAKEKSMLVRLPFFLILSALVSGCVSGPSGGQPPNYVEAELTQNPIPRGSMVAMPDLPGDIGGPE